MAEVNLVSSVKSPIPTPTNTSPTKKFESFLLNKGIKENILKENPAYRKIFTKWEILEHSFAKIVEGRQKTLTDKYLDTWQEIDRKKNPSLWRI